MRALIAGIVHESSTFVLPVTGPTTLPDFEVHAGPDLVRAFDGTNTVTGGYLASCGRHKVTAVPTLHARAEPGAAVDPAAYRALADRLLALAGQAGPVELVLLDLHGAGTLASRQSLEELLVHALRAQLGPDPVIAMTLDLHGNVPTGLMALTDVLIGFQEYPHTDMAVRAELAGDLAIAAARGTARPVVRKLALPMLLPPSSTLAGPAAQARDLARAAEQRDGVLACSVFHGFPYADTPHASAAVVTITDGDEAIADEVNGQIGRWLWDNRDRFLIPALPPERAVADALAGPGPVVIADGTDNPGSGAPGDSTYLLQALLDSRARTCLATLHDPAAVAAAVAAGVGTEIDVPLGGRHGWASGPPVPVRAAVRSITDGRVIQQVMRRGKVLDFGPCARLQAGRTDILVASVRRQVLDPEILLLHGIVPERYDIIAVKSVNHFRAGFASVSTRMLVADAPGPLTRDIVTLHQHGPKAALWPMNKADRIVAAVTKGITADYGAH